MRTIRIREPEFFSRLSKAKIPLEAAKLVPVTISGIVTKRDGSSSYVLINANCEDGKFVSENGIRLRIT